MGGLGGEGSPPKRGPKARILQGHGRKSVTLRLWVDCGSGPVAYHCHRSNRAPAEGRK